MLARYLFPKQAADSVFHIDFDTLWQKGIRGLVFDIDNTLATFDIPRPPAQIIEFLNNLAQKGFAIALLSNNSEKRVCIFSEGLGYPHIWKAGKPRLKGIAQAMAQLGLAKNQTAIIGDQIFTDILCGNRFGIHTILTKPIGKQDEWTVRLKRWPEKLVLKAYNGGQRAK